MVSRVSSKKIHMIAVTRPEGVRSSCGINGLPFDTEGDMAEIVLAKPVKGDDMKLTGEVELVTCKRCLQFIANAATRT